jgi:tRNA(His) 5'-end guanylyltransferase
MKGYEDCQSHALMRRMPVIVRVDGKSFHSLQLEKPFDEAFGDAMCDAVVAVAGQMQNFRLAYSQSDEASFLLLDTDSFNTEPWFGNVQNKIVSISASLMTAAFNVAWELSNRGFPPVFDSRAFNVPPEDVANYFLWRAKDCERNSVSMFAQAQFSPKQLHGKGRADMHEMLHGIGKNWATDVPARFRNGMFLCRDGSRLFDVIPTFEIVNALVAGAAIPRVPAAQ